MLGLNPDNRLEDFDLTTGCESAQFFEGLLDGLEHGPKSTALAGVVNNKVSKGAPGLSHPSPLLARKAPHPCGRAAYHRPALWTKRIGAAVYRLRWLLVKTYLKVGLLVLFIGFLFGGGR